MSLKFKLGDLAYLPSNLRSPLTVFKIDAEKRYTRVPGSETPIPYDHLNQVDVCWLDPNLLAHFVTGLSPDVLLTLNERDKILEHKKLTLLNTK